LKSPSILAVTHLASFWGGWSPQDFATDEIATSAPTIILPVI